MLGVRAKSVQNGPKKDFGLTAQIWGTNGPRMEQSPQNSPKSHFVANRPVYGPFFPYFPGEGREAKI